MGVVKLGTSYLCEFLRNAASSERGAIFDFDKKLDVHVSCHFPWTDLVFRESSEVKQRWVLNEDRFI